MDYPTCINQIATMVPIASSDPNFQTIFPGAISYAEGRMYRELDLLATRVSNTATVLSTAARTVALSTTSGYIQIVEEINVLTPAGAVSSATRNPVRFVTKQFIDNVYPSAVNGNDVPQYATMLTDTTVLLGPPPDQPYVLETVGIIQPTPLSSSNPTTWLTVYLPDVFTACLMVFISGWMKDFGAQSSDPAQAQSWETQYKTLFTSADINEARKMYRSQGWTSAQPEAVSTPARV